MAFVQSNINPDGLRVGDCTVRAIAEALDQSWEQTYVDLALQGLLMKDMPSANHVWGEYLRGKGFRKRLVPDGEHGPITVEQFAKDNPFGTYILAISGHGKDMGAVMGILDDLMDTLRVVNERAYNGVMRKIGAL